MVRLRLRGARRLYARLRSDAIGLVWRHPMSIAATLALVLLLGLIVMPVPADSESGLAPGSLETRQTLPSTVPGGERQPYVLTLAAAPRLERAV